MRLGQIVSLVRLRPFETDTEAGRSSERYRRLLLTTGATVGARALQAVMSLMTVPLALHHYGAERYGLWVAISSFLTLLVFVDQGLGAGLVQSLAAAEGKQDESAAREWITAAFVIVGAFGALAVLLLAASYPFVPWSSLFRVRTPAAVAEAGPAMAVLVGGFMLSALFGLVQRVYQGQQSGFVNNAWQVLGSALALAGVFALTRAGLGVPWLVAVMVGGPALASAASAVVLFGYQRPDLRPSPRKLVKERVTALVQASWMFLILQLALAATLAVDNLIVVRALGAEAVPGFSVPARLFYFVQMLVALVPQALWPAYREAIARGDERWARKAYWRATWYVLATSAVAAVSLFFAGPALLNLWVGDAVLASPGLLAGLGASVVAFSVGTNLSVFLSAANLLRAQVLLQVGVLVVSTAAKLGAVSQWGLAGIPTSMAISYACVFLIPGFILVAAAMRSGLLRERVAA